MEHKYSISIKAQVQKEKEEEKTNEIERPKENNVDDNENETEISNDEIHNLIEKIPRCNDRCCGWMFCNAINVTKDFKC